jgi:hypothetical protein
MTGLDSRSMRPSTSCQMRMSRSQAMSDGDWRISAMSPPAENAISPAPVMMITRTAASASAAATASPSARMVAVSMALRTRGRLMVTMRTGPSIRVMIVSVALMRSPCGGFPIGRVG